LSKALHPQTTDKGTLTDINLRDCIVKHKKRSFDEVMIGTTRIDSHQVEVQVQGSTTARDIMLVFERFPVWLVALEPFRVS
jgi:hypothetical protein